MVHPHPKHTQSQGCMRVCTILHSRICLLLLWSISGAKPSDPGFPGHAVLRPRDAPPALRLHPGRHTQSLFSAKPSDPEYLGHAASQTLVHLQLYVHILTDRLSVCCLHTSQADDAHASPAPYCISANISQSIASTYKHRQIRIKS